MVPELARIEASRSTAGVGGSRKRSTADVVAWVTDSQALVVRQVVALGVENHCGVPALQITTIYKVDNSLIARVVEVTKIAADPCRTRIPLLSV